MKTWFMAVAITVSAAVLPSQAQQTGTSKPPATAGLQKASPGQMGQIHEEVGAFLKQLSDLNAEADSAAEIARQGSEADVEKYKMKVEDIKGKIGGLATKIQEGGALTTNLKRMLTWAATQRRRLETQRIHLGEVVDRRLLPDYRQMEAELTANLDKLANAATDLQSLQAEVDRYEDQLAEIALAENAKAIVQEISQFTKHIAEVLGTLHRKLQMLGPAGA